jgi:hypothetical protein
MRYLKDLLVTDMFLIKGHANTGNQRLSTFLSNTRKRFLEMDEVILIKHDGGERVLTPWMLVRIDDIILAHEIEEAGDEGLRGLAEREGDKIAVTTHFKGNALLQLSGKVRKRAINSDTLRHHDFIVVVEPKIRGLTVNGAREYTLLENPSYVIVNRNRIAFIFQ